jgi:hypothetical protein
MNHKFLIILIGFVLSTNVAFSQFDKKEVPIPILSGNSITNNTQDTMWVLHSTKQFKRVAIALKNEKLYKELIVKHKQLEGNLDLLNIEQASYIDSLKHERQLYIQQVDESEADLALLAEMNKKQSKYTRIAIIVGASTTVTAFIVGFILGIK